MNDIDILKQLEAEENELQFDSFSHSGALDLGLFLAEKAGKEKLPITIHIDRNGQSIFHYALPGTTLDKDLWIRGKINVVYHFQHSSFYMKNLLIKKNKNVENDYFLDPRNYRAIGGAFPIIVKDTGIVAAAAVSGLPDRDDHEFLTRGIREFLELSDR